MKPRLFLPGIKLLSVFRMAVIARCPRKVRADCIFVILYRTPMDVGRQVQHPGLSRKNMVTVLKDL